MGRAWRGGRVRSIAAALKAAGPARGPGVRIPPPPSYEPSRPPPWPSRALPRFDRAAPAPAPPAPLAAAWPRHYTGTRTASSTTRSSARGRACAPCVLALLVLGVTALAQAILYVASGSVALLADLIHNVGDASTAIPLGVAFALRNARAERWAGLAVVLAIFVSACVAGYEAIDRLINPRDVDALGALAAAGAIGFAGNWVGGDHPHAGRTPPGQPRPGRRRRARARRRLRQPRRDRERRCARDRPASGRPADRAGDHRGDPADHLGLLEDRARCPRPLTRGAPSPTPSRGRSGWLSRTPPRRRRRSARTRSPTCSSSAPG